MNRPIFLITIFFAPLAGVVGGCAPTLASGETIAEVRKQDGLPTLCINNKPIAPVALIPIGNFPTDVCREFGEAGVHIYSHIIWNWRDVRPGINQGLSEANRWWLGPGRYDFDKVDRRIRAIIAGDPKALVFLRVKLNPPDWWIDAHPDELLHYHDGSRGPQHSMASLVWEETYERMLRDLIGHIESSDYADHIIGYQPAGGKTSEWLLYYRRDHTDVIDYSPAARKRFRAWLSDRYAGDVDELRRAWHDETVAFSTAQPPPPDLRYDSEYGLFRDPGRAQPAMDYHRFLSDITAHNIIRSCRICKEETQGRKITGVFYGYMLHWAHTRVLLANEGQLGLRQILESPYVDFLTSPPQYEARRPGDPGLFQSGYFGSYRLHGKLFWQEADIRTHLAPKPVHYSAANLEETRSLMTRQLGYALTEMNGLWWFTLAGDDTFRDDAIMQHAKRISDVAEHAMNDRGSRRHDVAVFADEETYHHMQMGSGALTYPLVTDMRRMLSRSGVVHDIYLLSDIVDPAMPDYKLYLMLNPFYLTDELRNAIKNKIRRNNAVAVWFYAPGFVQEDGSFSEAAIADLIGIQVRHRRDSQVLQMGLRDVDHPILAEGGNTRTLTMQKPIDPVFYADDSAATVVGVLQPQGEDGLVVKEYEDWRSIYFAAPMMDTALFRGIARYAGCHVYSETDDILDANSRYLMLHTTSAGNKDIRLPVKCTIRNLIEDRDVAKDADELHFTSKRPGETLLFVLER